MQHDRAKATLLIKYCVIESGRKVWDLEGRRLHVTNIHDSLCF